MSKNKRLKVVSPADTKLGRPTIMDRALAQRYGAAYVHTAAFAIDVDRARELDPEDGSLPFGWEVWLTEQELRRVVEEAKTDPTTLFEDMCLSVMDMPRPEPGELPAFGSQLPFAVYTGVARGHLPALLSDCFRVWKKPPTDLLDELKTMDAMPGLLAKLVDYCLEAPIEPPLVPPVREAMLKLKG